MTTRSQARTTTGHPAAPLSSRRPALSLSAPADHGEPRMNEYRYPPKAHCWRSHTCLNAALSQRGVAHAFAGRTCLGAPAGCRSPAGRPPTYTACDAALLCSVEHLPALPTPCRCQPKVDNRRFEVAGLAKARAPTGHSRLRDRSRRSWTLPSREQAKPARDPHRNWNP